LSCNPIRALPCATVLTARPLLLLTLLPRPSCSSGCPCTTRERERRRVERCPPGWVVPHRLQGPVQGDDDPKLSPHHTKRLRRLNMLSLNCALAAAPRRCRLGASTASSSRRLASAQAREDDESHCTEIGGLRPKWPPLQGPPNPPPPLPAPRFAG